MRDREPLPTKGQINAVSDLDVLQGWRDDIERVTVKIETDLEFVVGDPDWAVRARQALAMHRFTERLIGRRMGAVRRSYGTAPKSSGKRPSEDCDTLTIEVLAARPSLQVDDLVTTTEVDAQMAWLVARIDAMTLDREDEIGMEAGRRDEGFLSATGNALRLMRGIRQQLQNRRGELSRVEKEAQKREALAARTPVEETRERLFIDAARQVLDRGTYLALWDRVDTMQAQDAA